MKFALSSTLLLASFGAVLGQNSSAAVSSTTSAAASGSSTSSSSQMSSVATCTLFSGNPTIQPYGCGAAATTVVAPYDSSALAAFQVGLYKPRKSGEPISSIATDMAKTVTRFYPTLTVSFSDIVQEYVSVLSHSAEDYTRDGAVGSYNIPQGVAMVAMVAVAVVAGGAFVL